MSRIRYIFGENSGGRVNEDGKIEPQKLAMTAPVRTEQSQKLAMTSPVRTELLGKLRNMKVSFVMPKKVRYSGYLDTPASCFMLQLYQIQHFQN